MVRVYVHLSLSLCVQIYSSFSFSFQTPSFESEKLSCMSFFKLSALLYSLTPRFSRQCVAAGSLALSGFLK